MRILDIPIDYEMRPLPTALEPQSRFLRPTALSTSTWTVHLLPMFLMRKLATFDGSIVGIYSATF
jgi:hypothetical protein